MTDTNLRPCPFCGGKAIIRYTRGNPKGWTSNIYYPKEKGFVECLGCFVRTKEMLAKNAVMAWNRRNKNAETD